MVALVLAMLSGGARAQSLDVAVSSEFVPALPVTAPSTGAATSVRYEWSVTNDGPGDLRAGSLTISVRGSAGLQFLECFVVRGTGDCDTRDSTQGTRRTLSISGSRVSRGNISLRSGATIRVRVYLAVRSVADAGTVSATFSTGTQSDTNARNNSDSRAFTVQGDNLGAITHVASNRAFSAASGAGGLSTNRLAVAMPGAAGDHVVVMMMQRSSTAPSFSAPTANQGTCNRGAGATRGPWTQVGTMRSRGNLHVAVFSRIRLASDDCDSTAWMFTSSAVGEIGLVASAYRGAGPATPVIGGWVSTADAACAAANGGNGQFMQGTAPSTSSACYLDPIFEHGVRAMPITVTEAGGKLVHYFVNNMGSHRFQPFGGSSGLVFRRAEQSNAARLGASYRADLHGLAFGVYDVDVAATGTTAAQAMAIARNATAWTGVRYPIGLQVMLCPGSRACGVIEDREATPPVQIASYHVTPAAAATALTCTPSSVTITALDRSNNRVTPADGTTMTLVANLVSGPQRSGRGNWTVASGAARITSDPTADDGQATLTWNGSGSSVTLDYSNNWPQTVTITAASTSPSATGTSSSIVFSHNGLRLTDARGTAASGVFGTLVAGAVSGEYVLQAVESTACSSGTTGACTGACTASGQYSGAKNIEFQLACSNPSACAGASAVITNVDTGATTAFVATNAAAASPWTSAAMTFSAAPSRPGAGAARFRIRYDDVGQVTLNVRDPAPPVAAATASVSSPAFVVRPASLAVAQLNGSSWSAPVDHTSGVLTTAGSAITIGVRGYTSSGAVAPNFGRETPAGGASSIAMTSALVAPAGGVNPGFTVASRNAGTPSGQLDVVGSFGEVGIITLTPGVADYLGGGAVGGSPSANIGRFRPHVFTASAATLANRDGAAGAPNFTLLGESVRLDLTLEARNAAGARTRNYTGDYARFADSFNVGARNGTAADISARLGATIVASGSMAAGIGTYVLRVPTLKPTATDGPFDTVKFGIAPSDPDGVALGVGALTFGLAGGAADRLQVGSDTRLRLGRLVLLASTATGANNDASLPVESQYWTGATWERHADDNSTVIDRRHFAFSSWTAGLAACETGMQALAGSTTTDTRTMSAGRATMVVTAPGTGNDGSVRVTGAFRASGAAGTGCINGAAMSVSGAAWSQYHDSDNTVTVEFCGLGSGVAGYGGSYGCSAASATSWGGGGAGTKRRIAVRENF